LPEFDDKDMPISGTFGHGLGDDPTLGGILPGMTQDEWAILFELAEFTYFVDDDANNDPGPGDPNISDPLEDGSRQHPFDAIQEAINAATDSTPLMPFRRQSMQLQMAIQLAFLMAFTPVMVIVILILEEGLLLSAAGMAQMTA
jgi:hypothetical protein